VLCCREDTNAAWAGWNLEPGTWNRWFGVDSFYLMVGLALASKSYVWFVAWRLANQSASTGVKNQRG
jgi:hypothetical protein